MIRTLLTFTFLAAVFSHTANAWAANLAFGQTQTGAISSPAQSNSYTFGANANDVVNFTLVATSGSLVPKIQLYNSSGTLISSTYGNSPFACGGSTLEMNAVQLPSPSGTYTVLVSDCSNTNTGNYAIYAQLTDNPSGAANLLFGQTETGSIASAAASNTYTFSANASDAVDFTMATNGSLVPKIRLYNPAGTLLSSNYGNSPFACGGSTLEMNTVTLPTTGTYTVLVGDCGDTNTGNYTIYSQRTENPCCASNLPFGQTATGMISLAAESNSYTFSANANDVVDFTMVTNGSLVPKIRLYNPAGTLLSSNYGNSPFACGGSTLEMNTVTLPTTGTYTLLVGDCGDENTGNYTIYSQRTNNPTGAANLPFAQAQTGLLGPVAGSNTYTFSANVNDVVDFTMVTTNGSLVPKIRLYNPNGTLLSSNYGNSPFACGGSTLEMNTVTLGTTGTYTVLVGDCGDKNTGNYTIYSQRTNNPTGATGLLWGQVQSGMIGSAAQSGSYTLLGNANDVVNFTMVTTSGGLVPKIRLYNPNGTLLSSNYGNSPFACGGSTVQMNSVKLPASGSYTVLAGDCGDTNTGNYNLSSQCFGTCPLPSLVPAQIISPTPGTILTGNTVTFTWSISSGASAYWLDVGTIFGQGNIFGQNVGLNTSQTVSGIPANGSTIYVRLWTLLAGTWQYNAYTYTALTAATLLTPPPGSTLSGSTATFTWSAGSGASAYWLDVGTVFGQGNIFGQNVGLITSQTVSGIPTNGSTIYVRLWTLLAGTWQYNAYTYTAASPSGSGILTPVPGSVLPSPSATFTWTAVAGADQYWLDLGSAVGIGDYFGAATTGTSFGVNSLPCDARAVHVQLWTHISGNWQTPVRYTYTAASGCAALTSPANDAVFTGTSVTFAWNAISGADQYWLDVGNAIAQGDIFGGSTTATSITVNNIPCDSRTLYGQLWTHSGGAWHNPGRYNFVAWGACGRLTTPTPGSTLLGSAVTFNWNAGTGVTAYWLDVGTVLGQGNIYGANVGTAISQTVLGIPVNGSPIYVQLWSQIGGVWHLNRYSYTAF